MSDISKDLEFAIQTATAPAPTFADTVNIQVNRAGYSVLTFFFTPPAGAKYIRTAATITIPTQVAIALSQLIAKTVQQNQTPQPGQKGKKMVN